MKTVITLFIIIVMAAAIPDSNNYFNAGKGEELVLKYKVRLSTRSKTKTPIIILLHGVGGNEDDMFRFAKVFPSDYTVISARAPFEAGTSSYAWFHVQFLPDKRIINTEEAEKSRMIIKQFISQAVERFNGDSSQVYLLGFSQGGIMAYSVGLTAPEKLKGIGIIGGRLLDEVKPFIKVNEPFKKLNIFIAYGTNDNTMSLQYALNAFSFLSNMKENIYCKKYLAEHRVTDEQLQDFITWIKGIG